MTEEDRAIVNRIWIRCPSRLHGAFYDAGGGTAATGSVGERLRPLGLTPEDRRDLVELLRSL